MMGERRVGVAENTRPQPAATDGSTAEEDEEQEEKSEKRSVEENGKKMDSYVFKPDRSLEFRNGADR
jgi:hypothetical protein